jgi:FKBP-type peptidyl-prolyl cis-trans isomerase
MTTSLRRTAAAAALALALAACDRGDTALPPGNPDPAANTYAPALGVQLPAFYKTPNGVYYQDVTTGTGQVAIENRTAVVHYTGWLPNGTKFDASRDHGSEPFKFTIGAGQVIRGWEEGVAGMKVGGKRKLVIPAVMAYGNEQMGNVIPPKATLVFEVELVGVE